MVPGGKDSFPAVATRDERSNGEEDEFAAIHLAALAHELPLMRRTEVFADETEEVFARLGLTCVLLDHRGILLLPKPCTS